MFTKIFTGLNLLILLYIIIAGAFKDDPNNWAIPAHMVPNETDVCSRDNDCGVGGFAPYGIAGITKGAATCFFAFVGFDAIATTGRFKRLSHLIVNFFRVSTCACLHLLSVVLLIRL